jgi:recombination protein RecA
MSAAQMFIPNSNPAFYCADRTSVLHWYSIRLLFVMPIGDRVSQSSIAPLEALLVRLQAQWGEEVLRPVRALQAQSIPVIPTGSPSLDNALRGGISLVRLTELCGRPTSGMATLVYRLIAQAQRGGAYALWLDLPGTFDPASAARCGLHLEQLFILRLDAPDEALPILRDLRPGELPAETSLAAVRLLIERRTWLSDRHLVIGCRSRLTLLKGAAGPARAVDLDIYFEGP